MVPSVYTGWLCMVVWAVSTGHVQLQCLYLHLCAYICAYVGEGGIGVGVGVLVGVKSVSARGGV